MEGSWNYSRCRPCCSVTLHCVSLNCVALHWLAYHDPEMISTSRPTSTAHVTHSVGRSDWNPTTVISSPLAQSIGNEDVKLKCYVSAMPVLSGVLKMSCCTEFQRSECERLRQGWGRLPGLFFAAWWWRFHCFPPSTQSKPQITWWGCKSGSKRNPSPAFPTIIVAFCHPSHPELARTYTLQSMQNTLKLDFILIFQSISRKR